MDISIPGIFRRIDNQQIDRVTEPWHLLPRSRGPMMASSPSPVEPFRLALLRLRPAGSSPGEWWRHQSYQWERRWKPYNICVCLPNILSKTYTNKWSLLLGNALIHYDLWFYQDSYYGNLQWGLVRFTASLSDWRIGRQTPQVLGRKCRVEPPFTPLTRIFAGNFQVP